MVISEVSLSIPRSSATYLLPSEDHSSIGTTSKTYTMYDSIGGFAFDTNSMSTYTLWDGYPPTLLWLFAIDDTPPVIKEVKFDNKIVLNKDLVSNKPLITAIITDNIAIDPTSITVEVASKLYGPFTDPAVKYNAKTGLMELAINDQIANGKIVAKIFAADMNANKTLFKRDLNVGISGPDIIIYPNPFDPITEPVTIGFSIDVNANVNAYIFDMTGRIVAKKSMMASTGYNEMKWSGINDYSEIASNGVYMLRLLNADSNVLIGKGKIWVIKSK